MANEKPEQPAFKEDTKKSLGSTQQVANCPICGPSGKPICVCPKRKASGGGGSDGDEFDDEADDADDKSVDPEAQTIKKEFDEYLKVIAKETGTDVKCLQREGNSCHIDKSGVHINIPSPKLHARFMDTLREKGLIAADPTETTEAKATNTYKSPTPFPTEPRMTPTGGTNSGK